MEYNILFFENATFKKCENFAANSSFFKIFKDRYNGLPVLQLYKYSGKEDFQFYFDKINILNVSDVVFNLLRNKSLQDITDIDGNAEFTMINPDYITIEKFRTLGFKEINPKVFSYEISELVKAGSVYVSWEFGSVETEKMTLEFKNIIVGGRDEDFKIYKTINCWRGYILGFFVAYFIFDVNKGEIWFFSKDDYD